MFLVLVDVVEDVDEGFCGAGWGIGMVEAGAGVVRDDNNIASWAWMLSRACLWAATSCSTLWRRSISASMGSSGKGISVAEINEEGEAGVVEFGVLLSGEWALNLEMFAIDAGPLESCSWEFPAVRATLGVFTSD
jgi:hypothetical protein